MHMHNPNTLRVITPAEARALFPEAMAQRDIDVKEGMEERTNCPMCGEGKLCNWLPEQHVDQSGLTGEFYYHRFEIVGGVLWDLAGDFGGGYALIWDGVLWQEPELADWELREAAQA